MTRAQTRLTVQRLRRNSLLRRQTVLGGYYNLYSGLVEIIA